MAVFARTIGAAGSGKTHELMGIMEKLIHVHKMDPFNIGFCSFTRNAREEAANRAADRFSVDPRRLKDQGWFRTLHSCCYKILGVRKAQVVSDCAAMNKWVESVLKAPAKIPMPLSEDDRSQGQSVDYIEKTMDKSDETIALTIWEYARSRVWSLPKTWHYTVERNPMIPNLSAVQDIIAKYEQGKRIEDYLDFSDMLSRFAGLRFTEEYEPEETNPQGDAPDHIEAWFLDEAQDVSQLQARVFDRLVLQDNVKYVYLSGDPYQCQPKGTLVKTSKGYKPIEELNPESDNLIAFNIKDGRFYGQSKKIPFKVASRIVDSGELVEIVLADGTKHVSTVNHKWICRTHKKTDCFATYLMRKGDRWRVGTVQMFSQNASEASAKKNGEYRFGMRCNQEQADNGWILRVSETDREARAYEQVVSCKFGIPQVTFRPPFGKTNLDAGFIEIVFNSLGDLTKNAMSCLKFHDLNIAFPSWVKSSNAKNGRIASRKIHACNIIPGIMSMPKLNPDGWKSHKRGRKKGVCRGIKSASILPLKERVEWVMVESVNRLPTGTPIEVFSMDVEKHHTYVTQEYVTCNSIYSFAGSDPTIFRGWKVNKERKAGKSWRCPKPVLDLGEQVLAPCTDYEPRVLEGAGHEGHVITQYRLEDALSKIKPDESWMILVRANYLLKGITRALDQGRNPVPWTYLDGNGHWNAPSRNRACDTLCFMEAGEPITSEDWQCVLGYLKMNEKRSGATLLQRGTKKKFANASKEDLMTMGIMGGIFTKDHWKTEMGMEQPLKWLIETGDWRNPKNSLIPYACDYYRIRDRWGREVFNTINTRVGTIHSSKGSEADNVILLRTTTKLCQKSMTMSDEEANAERRCWYVAVTRARRNLYLVSEGLNKLEFEF